MVLIGMIMEEEGKEKTIESIRGSTANWVLLNFVSITDQNSAQICSIVECNKFSLSCNMFT